MLIINAEVYGWGPADVRIEQGRITALGRIMPANGEPVLDACGGSLLPSLHDHHIHLMSFAASLESVRCGPPEITDETGVTAALKRSSRSQRAAWIRGVGYHESVAGDIDRHWLDGHIADVPTRIQHRSGRLWIVNSAGLAWLRERAHDCTVVLRKILNECEDGRLYDCDLELRALWGAALPPIGCASRQLAAYGVTGLTDMTPDNSNTALATLIGLHADSTLLQRVHVGGALDLQQADHGPGIDVGPTKVHLHESQFPPMASLVDTIVASHACNRSVAVHCVTEAELAFALVAFREAGTVEGDRIEHAAVTPPPFLTDLKDLGLRVVTQPHFVAERGDAYLAGLSPATHSWLYRCRSFVDAGIPLAAGTDAPFGCADPWVAMAAAMARRTAAGASLGLAESLTPEQALALFLGSPEQPQQPRRVTVGAAADLCLLDRPWSEARKILSSACVRATVRGGRLIFNGVDQSPR